MANIKVLKTHSRLNRFHFLVSLCSWFGFLCGNIPALLWSLLVLLLFAFLCTLPFSCVYFSPFAFVSLPVSFSPLPLSLSLLPLSCTKPSIAFKKCPDFVSTYITFPNQLSASAREKTYFWNKRTRQGKWATKWERERVKGGTLMPPRSWRESLKR